jgi:GGDEF domain-containing protein
MAMIRYFIVFILLIPSVHAQNEICGDPKNEVYNLSNSVADVGAKISCVKKDEVDFSGIAVGCLTGAKEPVVGAVKAFINLAEFLFINAPGYLFKEAKEKIQKLLKGDANPIEVASAIASINMGPQQTLWDKAREYWDHFQSFAKDLKHEISKNISQFPCLPHHERSQIICEAVSNVFLLVFGPGKFLQGAKWTMQTGKALGDFVLETKTMRGLGQTSVAERLRKASQALNESVGKGTEILKLRNSSVTEVVLPSGEKILHYEQKIKAADGKVHIVKREVPLDAKTGAIDSNSAIGKVILSEAVQAKAGSGSLVFIDVNHLGKVNYFKKGTQGGDEYLASVAESLRKTLRPGDMVFKNGGDELVVILGTKNPETVKNISQRMMNEVDRNPTVRELFRQEVTGLTQKYRELNKATKLSDVSVEFRKTMSSGDLKLAEKDFFKYQTTKKNEIILAMQEQASYRGSISVG